MDVTNLWKGWTAVSSELQALHYSKIEEPSFK